MRLAGRHRVTERSGVFGEMHMLSNYWSIKYEERSVEVKEGRGRGEMVHCQDRYHSKRESKRRRADLTT